MRNKEKYNTYMNNYMKERWKKRKTFSIELLGGKCVNCGSKENLDFHHKDSSKKLFTIAKGSSLSNEKFDEELKKCELLCKNCHKIKHKADHGSLGMYSHNKCRCELCKTAWNLYHRKS